MAEFFVIINGLISLWYGLLAIYFAKRVRWPRGSYRRGWRTLIALLFAAAFFIGCAHTHFDIAMLAYSGELAGHWYEWESIAAHVAQAIGGLGFYIFATFWVKLSIYDKKDYVKTLRDADEEIAARKKFAAGFD